jgi:hypothetical protein
MQNETTVSRRNLLGAAAVSAAAIGTTAMIASPAGATAGHGSRPSRVPRDRISVQLYTLRNQLAIDLDSTLAELAEIGYTRVEHAGFVGRTAAEFRAALDRAGLRATSGHAGIPQPFDAAAWEATSRTPTSSGTGTSSTRTSVRGPTVSRSVTALSTRPSPGTSTRRASSPASTASASATTTTTTSSPARTAAPAPGTTS